MGRRIWTLEQRLQQSQMIQFQKPWEHSTGPKTPDGSRSVSKMNALKHGARCAGLRDAAREFTQWKIDYKRLISDK